jgi:hypothetical protein
VRRLVDVVGVSEELSWRLLLSLTEVVEASSEEDGSVLDEESREGGTTHPDKMNNARMR